MTLSVCSLRSQTALPKGELLDIFREVFLLRFWRLALSASLRSAALPKGEPLAKRQTFWFCQGLSLWERWHAIGRDGEGEAADHFIASRQSEVVMGQVLWLLSEPSPPLRSAGPEVGRGVSTPPPYLWTPPTPQRRRGSSPLLSPCAQQVHLSNGNFPVRKGFSLWMEMAPSHRAGVCGDTDLPRYDIDDDDSKLYL